MVRLHDVPRRIGGAAWVLVFVAGCVPHPVGPARTDASFERKAKSTLAGALSTTRTAAVTAAAGADGKATAQYLCIVLSEAEDSLGGVRGTFASIQPPSGKADARRREVLAAVDRAFADAGQARIGCRRGERGRLSTFADTLEQDAKSLEDLGGGK
jgi:hypothetical protein